MGMGWQVLSQLGLSSMLLPHATWSHWNSRYYFIQLDVKSYDIIQGLVHFTKMDVTLYQIKLIITILFYTRPSLGAIDQMFRL